ncbi:unnamed protein product, partial [Adineta steineri]
FDSSTSTSSSSSSSAIHNQPIPIENVNFNCYVSLERISVEDLPVPIEQLNYNCHVRLERLLQNDLPLPYQSIFYLPRIPKKTDAPHNGSKISIKRPNNDNNTILNKSLTSYLDREIENLKRKKLGDSTTNGKRKRFEVSDKQN